MVIGIDRFHAHFAGCDHQFVLIGGAACELIMAEAGLEFRATKDLDIVLIVEALDAAFAEHFWAFVEAGSYQIGERATGGRTLYRFRKPAAQGFPAMLELFSRTPEGLNLAGKARLTPLPIAEEAASLSAILLDPDYYSFLKTMIRTVAGLPVLNEAAIIPFKARAWLDLTGRRASGEKVDDGDIRKHRNDMARLLQLLGNGDGHDLPATVRADMTAAVAALQADAGFDPRSFGVPLTAEVVIERLRRAYRL
jgi:hypothetical protein